MYYGDLKCVLHEAHTRPAERNADNVCDGTNTISFWGKIQAKGNVFRSEERERGEGERSRHEFAGANIETIAEFNGLHVCGYAGYKELCKKDAKAARSGGWRASGDENMAYYTRDIPNTAYL